MTAKPPRSIKATPPDSDRIRIRSVELLSDRWAALTRTEIDYRRGDGTWEPQVRETYDRGNGTAVLPYDAGRRTVLLVRQFRYPAYATGHSGPLLEACAGLLEEDDIEAAIRREAREELGYQLHDLKLLYMPYVSPGSVTERLALFSARYSPADHVAAGGGHAGEGEDIEIVEMDLDDAFAAVHDGRIVDAKTILLIQHLMLAEGCPTSK